MAISITPISITPIGRTRAAPNDVYYVVHSSGTVGKRDHEVTSPLYETRWQADRELVRLRAQTKTGVFSVRMRTSPSVPAEWLSDVIMSDGSVVRAPLA